MTKISATFGTYYVKLLGLLGLFIAVMLAIILVVSLFCIFFVDGWNMQLSDVVYMAKGQAILTPLQYLFYRFSKKLVKIEFIDNVIHIQGNEVHNFSKASIVEINLFLLTVGLLKIDDKTYYFLPKEFYVFRFYYYTKKLRNLALIELRSFLEANIGSK